MRLQKRWLLFSFAGFVGLVGMSTFALLANGAPAGATTNSPTLVNTINVGSGSTSGPFDISDDGTDVWVGNTNDHTLTEIDVASGQIVQAAIPLPSSPQDVFSNGTAVWVTLGNGSVEVLNAANPTGVTPQTLSNVCVSPRGIAADGSHVWIACYNFATPTDDGGVIGVNESMNAIDYSLAMPVASAANPMSVASDGNNLYVAGASNNVIYRFAIPTGTLPISAPLIPAWSFDTTTHNNGAGGGSAGIALIGNNLYVGSIWTPYVLELNATTGAQIAVLTIDSATPGCANGVCNFYLTAMGTQLWVTNTGESTLSEFDGTTGTLVWGPTIVGGNSDGALGIATDSTHDVCHHSSPPGELFLGGT